MDRILVVDDDRDIVRLVRSYLEKAGYQVLTAYDGESALRVLRTEKPQLLILTQVSGSRWLGCSSLGRVD